MDGNRILGLINSYLSNDPNNPNPSQSTGSSNNNNNNNNSSMSSHRSGGRGRGNRPRHNRSGGGGYQNNQRNNQRNNNNNSNNNNNNSNSNNNSNRATVEVQGMPPKVGFGEWKSFVNNSTPKGTRWAQTDHKQGIWYLHCDNPNTAMTFVKCLNGKTYKGNQIKAVYNASRKGRDGSGRRTFDSSLQDNSKQQVFAELSKRYNAQKQFLNLSGLIKTFNGANWAQFENIAFTNHVLEIVKQNCPNVTTIDLKDNNIGTLQPFNRLHFFAPNVQNLCLSDNNFRYMSELNHLEGLKHNLRELILPQQNLMRDVEGVNKLYVYEIKKRFPSLRMLDNQNVSQNNSVGFGNLIDQYNNRLNTVGTYNLQYSCHNRKESIAPIFENFIKSYFNAFDNSRMSLIDMYHNSASFSLVLNMDDSPTPYHRSESFNKLFQSCKDYNRNLIDPRYQKFPDKRKKIQRVVRNKLNIVKYLSESFPQTRHILDFVSIDVGAAFKVDNNDMIQIMLIGYYGENNTDARKFQRTWLVVPANNTVSILNDQLYIGGSVNQKYLQSNPPVASVEDSKVEANKSQSLTNSPQRTNNNNSSQLSQQQTAMINQVCQQCNCSQEIAFKALNATNWNGNDAITRIKSTNFS